MNKKFTIQLLWEILGSILIAAAIYNFAVQAVFPMTGFSGISIILYRLANIPIGLSTVILNIPVALLSYKLIGRNFFISTIRCMVISSIFIDYIAPLFPVYDGDRLLAALCTGVIGGLGYSIMPMIVSLLGACGFRIFWVAVIFPLDPTLSNLYLSYPISWILTALTHLVCYLLVSRRLPADGELPPLKKARA